MNSKDATPDVNGKIQPLVGIPDKAVRQEECCQEIEREQQEFTLKLVDIASKLNNSLELDTILDHIIQSLVEIVPTTTCNILLAEGNNGRIIRQHGYEQMGTGEILSSRIFDFRKIKTFKQMLKKKQGLFVSDTHDFPDWVPMPESFWVRSFVAAPIIIKGEVYAFLNCDNGTPEIFNEKHVRRLQLVADQAAIAIENANVYSETKNRLNQIALINDLTRTMLDSSQMDDILLTLPQKILAIFGANSLLITQWDPEKKLATQLTAFGKGLVPNFPKSTEPDTYSLTEQVINQKHALVISTKEGYLPWQDQLNRTFNDRLILALPMITQENPLGAMLIGFSESKHISETEIAIGEYAALQIATIIHKSNVYEEAKIQSSQFQHANDLIASLNFVAASILSTKGLPDILKTMGDGLEKMHIHSLLFIREQQSDTLSIDYCSRSAELFTQLKMLDWTPEKKVSLPTPQTEEFRNTLDNRQIVFIDDPVQLLKYAIPCKYGPFVNKFQEALDITAESKSLFLPLIVERKTIGLLGLYGENLQEIDLKAGEIFNSQISIALENSRLLAEVQRLAITDELTGINNRRGLFELGSREFLISKRMNRPLSALMIDLDNFKDINDRYGHAAGDFTLHEIAKRISDNIREIDIIGRYGGEEFVVLLIGDNLQSSMVAAERIREAISNNKVITETDTLQVTVSIGVDELDSLTANLDALIKRADRALYIAKHNGRNRVATLMNLENSR